MQPTRYRAPLLLTLICGCSLTSGVARAADQVGRYELAVSMDGRVYVLDTATGDCWSKLHRGRWVSEGNPTRPAERPEATDDAADIAEARVTDGGAEAVRGPITLALPREEVELTIHQRDAKAIPGSDDRLFVRLGDITGGQVLVTVETDDGELLLDEASLGRGDSASFRVGGRPFLVRIRSLRNFLTGDDFAVLDVAADEEREETARESVAESTEE